MSLLFSLGAFAETVDLQYSSNIIIRADRPIAEKILKLIQTADMTAVGKSLFTDIRNSKNKLLIEHNVFAVDSAGITYMSMRSDLITPGKGVDANIQMNFLMPDSGSHIVYKCGGGKIAFTALVNFVHELRHARDGMTGNFIGHMFEKDAVATENALRAELGYPADEQRCLRDDEDHIWQVWPEEK